MDVSPYDALLFVSFGGPEKTEDVVPFLENVTRGRGIPRERLVEVGQHYFDRGGKSPINDQNRAFLAALRSDLAEHGIDLPVYWGNRNWDPYLSDTVAQMRADGIKRAAVFATSAYSSYSSCRQYRENLFEACDAALTASGSASAGGDVESAPVLDKLRRYYNHPGFVAPVVDGVLASIDDLPEDERDGARLLFVTHSIPTSMNDNAGPDGNAYVAQHLDVAAVIAEQVAQRRGVTHEWDLVYCSRSGAPHIPWLEPDVNDHLQDLAGKNVSAVVMCPVGFVSDHMEVVYDLDTEAMATAEKLGIHARRSPTAGEDPRFVAAVRELLLERAAAERAEAPERPTVGDLGPGPDRCPVGCCFNQRSQLPTLSGEDSPQYSE